MLSTDYNFFLLLNMIQPSSAPQKLCFSKEDWFFLTWLKVIASLHETVAELKIPTFAIHNRCSSYDRCKFLNIGDANKDNLKFTKYRSIEWMTKQFKKAGLLCQVAHD